MKIDFIISTLGGGGAERVLSLMVNSLARNNNNQIRVITLLKAKDSYTLDPLVGRVILDKNQSIPGHTLRSLINLYKFYKTKSNRPDIIISFVTLTNFIAINVAKLFSIKIIAQEHNSYLRFMKNRKFLTLFTRKYLYKKADMITVLTSFDVSYYENFGAKVCVMPNPCSFIPIKNNSHTREKVILSVGNLNRYHHKGFDNLIEIIAPILQEKPKWKLKIAGSGDEGLAILKDLVKKKNITNQVIFTGFINNVSEIMYNSSIYVLPSRFEGLPMVLLEAMSQGMACISFNCKTGPSDVISHNINGLLIEDQNLDKMKMGILELISNEHLRLRLSNEGIKSLEKYDITSVTKKYQILLNKLARKQ